MRVAIIGDIHSNLTALRAVLEDARQQGVEQFWCLGDIVGYGPEPSACIEIVQERATLCVAGNHDLGAAGRIGLEQFNPYAAQANIWTSERLSDAEKTYLGSLPGRLQQEEVTLAHASPRDPVWEYVVTEPIAEANFPAFTTKFCFVGHSHLPFLCLQPAPEVPCGFFTFPAFLGLAMGEGRAIINPGSVGQPRDRDPRSSYVVYDRERQVFYNRRVAYDIRATQELMAKGGLPYYLINRLSNGA